MFETSSATKLATAMRRPPMSIPDVVATLVTAALVVLWYVDRSTFWFLQDAFGIALCFVFLRTIRLPTLQVASVLLVLAFFYDIFFVFVTPLLFGRSVMDVATGGQSASSKSGYPGVDFCERYPAFDACLDPQPLPMLLLFPRFHDWRGGQAMLVLGDIVLPGLLLCFALRFDYAREVHVKQTDPALLYLVPCTLGGISIAAFVSGDLHQMWHDGPYPVHPMAPTLHSPFQRR
ncbi:hypothetical protein H257_01582 [Aphanomyces astaci]|uniref:Uncharacterized protein n=1 Tax=Aphanomyces astaci TaxID=112090 RepID=W4H8C8_APHAT|nr:hypothetical protein H257_01582 [Aphanomyces astaci]ETV88290.1 hypothetical protein H257_01582 [Aphanomyces astaci]|eukprot:XP_009823153.1 hypothetical protein H257_01582 [Aphanomyces astaci]